MKSLMPLVITGLISGCSLLSNTSEPQHESTSPSAKSKTTSAHCPGTIELPNHVANAFELVQDAELLAKALGEANQGKLCQGQVYQLKPGAQLTLYRVWNSTNPKSQLGKWWAWHQPQGKIAQYHADYEICYQWSPLDKLSSCELKPGTKVVVGTGQSAKCSSYLTYPTSTIQQVFIANGQQAMEDCQTWNAVFAWK